MGRKRSRSPKVFLKEKPNQFVRARIGAIQLNRTRKQVVDNGTTTETPGGQSESDERVEYLKNRFKQS